MGKQRIHLSLHDSILQKLDAIAEARDFGDRVALFEQLVREEWERRHGPAVVRDAPLTPEQAAAAVVHTAAASATPGKPVSYGAKPAKPKKPQSPKSSP